MHFDDIALRIMEEHLIRQIPQPTPHVIDLPAAPLGLCLGLGCQKRVDLALQRLHLPDPGLGDEGILVMLLLD